MMKSSFSGARKSGLWVPVLNDTAVFTAAGLSSRTAARASFIVFPDSRVASTSSTRLPVTRRGGPAITEPSREIAIDAKSRCRMLATTAPGITPALAIPMTTSGSYSRNTLRASTRHSSPKNAQSTCRTPRGVLPARVPPEDRGVVGRGGGAMVGDSTLPTSGAASYFRPMGFWRSLFGGGGSSSDDLRPQRLDYLNEALALERQGDYEAALTSYRLALRDLPNDARILQNIAIAFTKTPRLAEAIRPYRPPLAPHASLPGPHHRPAFLLLQRSDPAP